MRCGWPVWLILIGCSTLLPASLVLAVEPPFEIEEVAEGIYSVRREFAGTSAAIIVIDHDVVVVDSHVSLAAACGTLSAIREITDKPVRYVFNTHWHTDHVVGNWAYLELTGRID